MLLLTDGEKSIWDGVATIFCNHSCGYVICCKPLVGFLKGWETYLGTCSRLLVAFHREKLSCTLVFSWHPGCSLSSLHSPCSSPLWSLCLRNLLSALHLVVPLLLGRSLPLRAQRISSSTCLQKRYFCPTDLLPLECFIKLIWRHMFNIFLSFFFSVIYAETSFYIGISRQYGRYHLCFHGAS